MAAHLFEENQNTCPQTVMLEDGAWMDAPWMTWSRADASWRRYMRSNSGNLVTADHLAAPKQKGPREGPCKGSCRNPCKNPCKALQEALQGALQGTRQRPATRETHCRIKSVSLARK